MSLINSLQQNFTKATTLSAKEKLAESVDGLMKSVGASLDKVSQRLSDETASKLALQKKYDLLVEKQRKYFKLVKEYQSEAQKAEQLELARAGKQ